MSHFLESSEVVLKNLNTSTVGLNDEEIGKRLLEHGKNELKKAKKKTLVRRFIQQLINPMLIVLSIAAMASLVIAIVEKGVVTDFMEAVIIFAIVLLNAILGVVQESKAEKAIEALQKMNAATAKVRRNGVVLQIPASDVVPGDIVLIEAGDAIPADMRLTHCASLRIEESSLTGESVPTHKTAEAIAPDANGKITLADRKNMAYMGSTVVYGRGEGVVTETGMNTEVGKIAQFIHDAGEGTTPLQRKLSHLSKVLSFLILGICVVVFVVRLVTTGQYNASGIMASFMLAVALAVAAIPEGLAAVVTIALSVGVTKMAKQNAIVRRLTAVETLGCVQVICSDKTGTLTQNKMTVVEHFGDTHLLAKAMVLCSDSRLSADGTAVGDPTENALIYFAMKQGIDVTALEQKFPRIAEVPFDSIRKLMSTIHKDNNKITQYTKGAPDELLKVCTHALIDGKEVVLTSQIKQSIIDKNKEYSARALRVLACGYKNLNAVPADCTPEKIERGLVFLGLQAMIDPVRPEILAAMESCRTAGIRVVMITGDHKETASAIAKELGIITDNTQAVTGSELDSLSDEEFEQRIESIRVYARVQPDQKVRIVNMWKKKGFITAMTGDGVNDAPAIKSGDIGVGMGITGTDVTKNVADIVLADDNFATIVSAVKEGRRIYDNIQKTIQFLLSVNFSEVLTILIATCLGFTVFKPIHLLCINLVTDTVPAIAASTEHASKDVMKRSARDPKKSIYSDGVGIGIIYQGLFISALTLASFFTINAISTHGAAMTAAFFTLSLCGIFQAFTLRSLRQSVFTMKKQNKLLWGAMAISLAITLILIYVPFMATAFSLEPLSLVEVSIALGLAFLIIPIVETGKVIYRKGSRARVKKP